MHAIIDLCFRMNLSTKLTDRVIAFCERQGEETTLNILNRINDENQERENAGLDPEPKVSLWTRYAEEYVRRQQRDQTEVLTRAEHERMRREHEAAKSKGIDPDDIEWIHAKLREKWDQGSRLNPISKRTDLDLDPTETEQYYGYIGLSLMYDPYMARVLMETDLADNKINQTVINAIKMSKGAGNVNPAEFLIKVRDKI